jgi:CheY-like chemotaxis protein
MYSRPESTLFFLKNRLDPSFDVSPGICQRLVKLRDFCLNRVISSDARMVRILLYQKIRGKVHLSERSMVLLVDDDRGSCEALAEFLSLRGHDVQCATNGNEALRLLAESQDPPAVIFLDLMMPVLDGWSFLAERAKNPLLAEIPVVIVSGCRDVTQKAKEAGAIAVMCKPVEAQSILRVVEHFDERP